MATVLLASGVSAAEPRVVWRTGLPGTALALAVGADGRSAVVAGGFVLAVDDGGHIEWQRETIEHAGFVTIVADGIAVASVYNPTLARYDHAASLQWRRRVPNLSQISGFASGPAGNLVIGGNLYSDEERVTRAVLLKCDRQGRIVWRRVLPPLFEWATINDVTVGRQGRIATLSDYDFLFYVERFQRGGARVWQRLYGVDEDDSGRGIAIDDTGAVTIAGDSVDWGPETTFGWVRRYDPVGRPLWATVVRPRDREANASAAAVLAGPAGSSAYVAGNTDGPLQGESLPATAEETGRDIWLANIDAVGSVLWLHRLARPGDDSVRAIGHAPNGDLILIGSDSAGSFITRLQVPAADAGQ